jgi:pyrophosphatase PpaX
MIKAVIFDIDGVLIDSLKANHKLFRSLLKQAGYEKLPTLGEYKKFFHLTASDTFKELTGAKKKEINRLMQMLHNTKRSAASIKVTPGSVSAIKRISKNYRLALVTSRIEAGVEHYMEVTKTKELFEVIVHYGHYKNPKPHPEPLLLACKRLRIKPEQTVYIGDAHTDIAAARAANMKVILYPKTKLAGATAYAPKFSDIPRIVSLMNKGKI